MWVSGSRSEAMPPYAEFDQSLSLPGPEGPNAAVAAAQTPCDDPPDAVQGLWFRQTWRR